MHINLKIQHHFNELLEKAINVQAIKPSIAFGLGADHGTNTHAAVKDLMEMLKFSYKSTCPKNYEILVGIADNFYNAVNVKNNQ